MLVNYDKWLAENPDENLFSKKNRQNKRKDNQKIRIVEVEVEVEKIVYVHKHHGIEFLAWQKTFELIRELADFEISRIDFAFDDLVKNTMQHLLIALQVSQEFETKYQDYENIMYNMIVTMFLANHNQNDMSKYVIKIGRTYDWFVGKYLLNAINGSADY